MINFTTEDTDKGKRITIEGEATIETAGKLLEYSGDLFKEVAGATEIELSFEKVSRIDVAFLQVIQALKTSLSDKDISLTVHLEKMKTEVRGIIELTGFCRQLCGRGY
jgi:ABC-type transporter Mla MlaB component